MLPKHTLTHEELRVVRLTAMNDGPERIAKTMGVSLDEIRDHMEEIREKLKFHPTPERCKNWIDSFINEAKRKRGEPTARTEKQQATPAPAVYNPQEPTRSQLECLVLYAQGFDFTHIATALDYSHIQSPQNAVSLACKRLGISTGKHKRRRALVRAWLEKKGHLPSTPQAVTMEDEAF